ncbi:MAG: hypothetical protein WAZ12_02765 [Candidatus Absconditicoccaceae bacterium]
MEQYTQEEIYEEEYEEEQSLFSKIWKILKYILIIAFIVLIVFSIIRNIEKSPIEDTNTSNTSIFTQEYIIQNDLTTDEKVYGVVVSDNLINITNSIGGTISYENCQPGKKVFTGEMIYHISPSDDVATQNSNIQLSYIKKQIDNLKDIISHTQNSFDIQNDLLKQQEEVNQRNYLLFRDNMENLEQQKDLNSDDMDITQDNMDKQLDLLQQSQNIDLSKLNVNIDSFKQQLKIAITDTMRKLDDTFGITDSTSNVSYDSSLSANNPSLKSQVKSDFNLLNSKLNNIIDMTDDDLSEYITDLSNLFSLASKSVDASIASIALPQTSTSGPSIETFYTMFSAYSTSLQTYKTNFQSLASAYHTTLVNYDAQINSLQNNIDSMDDNKSPSAELTFDSNINTMKSQLNNLELSTTSISKQIQNSDNTQSIQLGQLQGQYLTLAQNYELLVNNLGGEVIKSPINGIIKVKQATQLNKVNPNTMLCQIVPVKDNAIKIQIFSPYKLDIGQKIIFLDGEKQLGEGQIEYQLPYVDPTTQNYTYEIISTNIDVVEGQRLSVAFQLSSITTGNIMIPLDYVQPKLDGYYVYIKIANAQGQSAAFDKKIQVGDIDNGYIQVLSGLQIGNIIMK